jgi:periplasmic protein TonB
MAPQEKMDTQEFIIDRLHEIHRNAEANNFAEALASIKEVKEADTKNIYLVAIEKQISKLNDPALQEEHRTTIIKSLPPMIDRAISDIHRRAVIPKTDDSQKVQKEAALEKLKSQYFQRADDYVEKKEYQRALEEIRRIYIIEPGSVVAKEYENKIEQLSALQSRSEIPAVQPEIKKESKMGDPASVPALETSDGPKKSRSSLILISAAGAIVVIAVGAWFMFSKNTNTQADDQMPVQQSAPAVTQQSTIPTSPSPSTAAPPTEKVTQPVTDSPKQPASDHKTTPDSKPAASEQKPVQAPVTTQPIRTQSPPVQQQAAPSQPVVNTPPSQPPPQQTKAAESTPAPMPFVAIETQPELIHREAPVYPELAKKMGIQGRVTIEVSIDAQGKPIQAKVIKSASEVLNGAAIEAVMKYTFKPAMMSTGPVTAKVYIPIDFRLTH